MGVVLAAVQQLLKLGDVAGDRWMCGEGDAVFLDEDPLVLKGFFEDGEGAA